MEYVDGPSLRVLLDMAPDPFDASLALAITRCVAEGLGAAHARGMIHLDLKPESILIARNTKSMVPKIAEFGIGATRENANTFLTAGRILLTPTYAAPEQWRDTRSEQLDGRTDLYALGRNPFRRCSPAKRSSTWLAIRPGPRQHLNAPPRMRRSVNCARNWRRWHGLDGLDSRTAGQGNPQRPSQRRRRGTRAA